MLAAIGKAVWPVVPEANSLRRGTNKPRFELDFGARRNRLSGGDRQPAAALPQRFIPLSASWRLSANRSGAQRILARATGSARRGPQGRHILARRRGIHTPRVALDTAGAVAAAAFAGIVPFRQPAIR